MSRSRAIDYKVQKDVRLLQKQRRPDIKKKEDQSSAKKDDVEMKQISELLYKLPSLQSLFDLHRKIGEGTFSSVYLGSLRQHAALPDHQKRWYAIKHLVPTSHPARIEQELKCLLDIGGKEHVIGVELCLRNLDTVVFVMPYIPHKKFSDYVGDMDSDELREYMRALLTALRHVHSFGVIHRDVKPSNFLYDREHRRYQLVDFGLAQRICPASEEPPPAHTSTYKRPRLDDQSGTPGAKRLALDLRVRSHAVTDSPSPAIADSPAEVVKAKPKEITVQCVCAGRGMVCAWCGSLSGARAPRAGTQGFRPPEVLLKSPRQGPALDVWASGVVLASVLTARYPLLRAADDIAALAELTDLLGTKALQRAANKLGRRIICSPPRRGLCLRKLCLRLRSPAPSEPPAPSATPPCRSCRLPAPECLCRDDSIPADQFSSCSVLGFPDSAFSLAARLLEPEPGARPSAAAALQHPFFTMHQGAP